MWSYIIDLGDNSSVDAFASEKKCIVDLFVCQIFFVN